MRMTTARRDLINMVDAVSNRMPCLMAGLLQRMTGCMRLFFNGVACLGSRPPDVGAGVMRFLLDGISRAESEVCLRPASTRDKDEPTGK